MLEYYLDKEQYLELLHFCRRYDRMKQAANDCYGISGIDYSKSSTSGNRIGDPTARAAFKAISAKNSIELIDRVLTYVANEPLRSQLKKSVIYPNMPYEKLGNVPMGRRQFYKLRRRFFYELALEKEVTQLGKNVIY